MALLNVSMCSSKLPPKPSLSLPSKPHPSRQRLPLSAGYPAHQVVNNSLEASEIVAGRVHLQGEPDRSALYFCVRSRSCTRLQGPYGSKVTRGQDLTGKDFSGKTSIKQDFKTSILRQANFKGAKLLGASFFDADLTGADLSDADLRAVDFSLANTTKANLRNANLEGAVGTGNTSFKGSNITGAGGVTYNPVNLINLGQYAFCVESVDRLHRCAFERRST